MNAHIKNFSAWVHMAPNRLTGYLKQAKIDLPTPRRLILHLIATPWGCSFIQHTHLVHVTRTYSPVVGV